MFFDEKANQGVSGKKKLKQEMCPSYITFMLQNTQKKNIKESRICDLVLSGFIVLKMFKFTHCCKK